MKLYKYYIYFGKFKKVEYEVVEKPKTFVIPDIGKHLKKVDVESIKDVIGNVVFWTTINDDERASKELTRFYKNKQQRLEELHERRVNEIKKEIASLKQKPEVTK